MDAEGAAAPRRPRACHHDAWPWPCHLAGLPQQVVNEIHLLARKHTSLIKLCAPSRQDQESVKDERRAAAAHLRSQVWSFVDAHRRRVQAEDAHEPAAHAALEAVAQSARQAEAKSNHASEELPLSRKRGREADAQPQPEVEAAKPLLEPNRPEAKKARSAGHVREPVSVPRQPDAQSRQSFRKGGATEELTEESFAVFYLAMAAEVLVRAGRLASNDYLEQLPPRARARFSAVRRCTWSWLTDSTSLALAGRLVNLRGSKALRAIVLAQVAFTSPEAFAALCDGTDDLDDVAAVKKVIVEHQECDAAVRGRPARRSTISRGLQTGSLSRLPPGPTMNDKVAAFVVKLNGAVDASWARVVAGESPGDVLCDPSGLHLPGFRALCCARWLWISANGKCGESPDSLGLGDGARDALQKLADGASEGDFGRALPRLRAAVEKADTCGILPLLRRLGLLPDEAQTYEHLLCEAGKVFGEGRREGRGAPRPGYKEAFDAALPLYARLAKLPSTS